MSAVLTESRETGVAERVAGLDWQQIVTELDSYGCAVAKGVLTPKECRELSSFYDHDEHFRRRIVMARHGFGRGEYKYWAYPLPETIETLRTTLYPHLAEVANRWNQTMKIDVRYPATHAAYLEQCHSAGQVRPTPLLLQYDEGDFNCLHQDVYGDLVFPLQIAFLLSVPREDFTGGEFVLVEQRPRMQSRAEVVQLGRGDGVIFAVHHRPAQGTHGAYRVNLRHGVSRIHSGRRHTLGIIFHDAK
ncbi:MAG: 2OG-Fe(II) oxygenase [Chthoniobacterales bacterium]